MPPEPFKKKTGKFKINFLAKNAPKKRKKKKKIVSGPLGNVKTYLDAKFQLIWPSNEATDKKDTLLKTSSVTSVCGPTICY